MQGQEYIPNLKHFMSYDNKHYFEFSLHFDRNVGTSTTKMSHVSPNTSTVKQNVPAGQQQPLDVSESDSETIPASSHFRRSDLCRTINRRSESDMSKADL